MSENNEAGTNEAQINDREIVITRILDVGRELAFEVWTKEKHLSQWWGPEGFTTTFRHFDLRPGGTWQFIMHGPDGVDYPNTNVFIEIVRPERIVIEHTVFPHFLATATFEELDGKTRLTYRSVFQETEAVFDKIKTYAAPGAEQMLDRLERHLADLRP